MVHTHMYVACVIILTFCPTTVWLWQQCWLHCGPALALLQCLQSTLRKKGHTCIYIHIHVCMYTYIHWPNRHLTKEKHTQCMWRWCYLLCVSICHYRWGDSVPGVVRNHIRSPILNNKTIKLNTSKWGERKKEKALVLQWQLRVCVGFRPQPC